MKTDKKVLSYIIMILLSGVIVDSALSVGPPCNPDCDSFLFDWCRGEFRCIRCSECSCTTCTSEGCQNNCGWYQCKYCKAGNCPGDCSGCATWCSEGQTCCNGEKFGTCYDPETQKCCGGHVIDKGTCKKCVGGEWVSECEQNQRCCFDECRDLSTTTVSYDTGLSTVVSGIESGINSIPRVTASGWSASASFSATKGEECCYSSESIVDYYTVSGSVNVSGTVSVEVPGLSWSWNQEYGSLGKIDASLGISIVPSITVNSASVSASGRDSDCGSCLTLSGSGEGTGQITCTAGGVVTLTAFPESDWLNYELNVNVSAQAQASVTAWASGGYNKGDAQNCEPQGFCLMCYGASNVEVTGTVTFQVGPLGPYSATSDPIIIVEGCHVHPEC